MPNIEWEIGREGRTWRSPEGLERYMMLPRKMELVDGKLYSSDEARLLLLGCLLENLGIDNAVRLGDPKLCREAVADLENGS